ncbi:LOW QUALITY PROTEIN: uncharacterized protein [Prorops nasuta]|uniref:LOW QUALITY PROTEIN: uncharacterized protein n=1 Tax=Prorops nasuta TaxID=863751 RepID=UPI0034CE6C73
MIDDLRTKFNDEHTSQDGKVQILTLLPKSWSIATIAEIFGASKHMVILAKSLKNKKGILSKPGLKIVLPLSNEIKSAVLDFYIDDETSVNLPGMNDVVSVRNDHGKRVHLQKRLILSNLKELYKFFKKRYPDYKIGFSKFATLRPQQCVLVRSSGTHTIYVCSVHQNVKLMMIGSNLPILTKDLLAPLRQYNDCIKMVICEDPLFNCYFERCDKCPGIKVLRSLLTDIFYNNDIDDITYKYWVTNPRTSLETFTKTSTDFVDSFCDNIKNLLPHAFIAKEQSHFFRSLKESLKSNEVIIVCDFAENYEFVVQNAAPGFHWNNNQATIYPIVIYFTKSNELFHNSLVTISDYLQHVATSVHLFSKVAVNYIINKMFKGMSKIFYFSDGAPQQFKNFKNFANLSCHEEDFGLKAEWHFFATAHGKGAFDGIGGTVKRMAARASLQLPLDRQITNPKELYEWATRPNNLKNISIFFVPQIDYTEEKRKLEIRYRRAQSVKGTQKFHCVIPIQRETLQFKKFSRSDMSKVHKIFK